MEFEEFNLSNEILSGLKDVNYSNPTKLQTSVMPAALDNKNLLVHARKGMGKHGAFIIPILEKVVRADSADGTIALVLTPSPEGAQKVDEMLWAMGYHAEVTTAVVKLGGDWEEQKKALADQPNVIVANPGRLVDHLRKEELKFEHLNHLVIDELDEFQSIGIMPMLQEIKDRLPSIEQTVLFTGKINKAIRGFGKKLMGEYELLDASGGNGKQKSEKQKGTPSQKSDVSSKEAKAEDKETSKSEKTETKEAPQKISLDDLEISLDNIHQNYIRIPGRTKISTFMSYMESEKPENICVFTASKRGSNRLSRILEKNGYTVGIVNDQIDEQTREERFEEFQHEAYQFLLISDLSSAELPIKGVHKLINYDIPPNPEEYKHRLNLLATDQKVEVVSLVSKQDQRDFNQIAKALGLNIEELPLPEDVQKKIQNRKKNQGKEEQGSKEGNASRNKQSRSNNRKVGGKSDKQKSNHKKGRPNNKKSNKKGGQGKKKFKPEESSELPRPNYDQLKGGEEDDKKKGTKKEKKGVVGFFKKIFSS